MTNNNDRDELRRIYKCIWFDFSDDVNREDMWIKEFENYAAKQVAKAERATKQKELDRLEMEVSMCDNPSKFSPVKYLEIRRAELQQDGE